MSYTAVYYVEIDNDVHVVGASQTTVVWTSLYTTKYDNTRIRRSVNIFEPYGIWFENIVYSTTMTRSIIYKIW